MSACKRLSAAVVVFVIAQVFTETAARALEMPSEPIVRDAVIARLKRNNVSVGGLSPLAPGGMKSVSLGIGPTGSPADNANDENLRLIGKLPDVERLAIYKGAFSKAGLSALAALPNLRQLNIYSPNAAPQDFAPLADLANLESLQIGDYAVTDEMLEYAGAIRGLRALEITPSVRGVELRVTSAGVAKFLDSAKNLEELLVFGDAIDDACLERISRRQKMKRLWTNSRAIAPTAWGELAALTELRDLYLRGTSFDDHGMRALAGMKELRSLMLDNTRITDAGMRSLAGLSKLSELGLSGTKVTDAGIAHLRGMIDLRNLYVAGTQVTVDGLKVVPRKEQMSMLRVGRQPLSPREFSELRAMYQRTEIFDSSGFWSPDRERAARQLLNDPGVLAPKSASPSRREQDESLRSLND